MQIGTYLFNRKKLEIITISDIKIRMHGKAKTCWSQGRHSNSETESYLEEEVFLLGNGTQYFFYAKHLLVYTLRNPVFT